MIGHEEGKMLFLVLKKVVFIHIQFDDDRPRSRVLQTDLLDQQQQQQQKVSNLNHKSFYFQFVLLK